MSLGSMSHVYIKNGPCLRVEFRGQGPQLRSIHSSSCVYVYKDTINISATHLHEYQLVYINMYILTLIFEYNGPQTDADFS